MFLNCSNQSLMSLVFQNFSTESELLYNRELSGGQRSLVAYSPRDHKEQDVT